MTEYRADLEAVFYPARSGSFFERPPSSERALCAELSRLAYLPAEAGEAERRELEAALSRAGLSLREVFSESGTQAFLAGDELRAFLVFRGTETGDWQDLHTNSQAWPVDWEPGGQVHSGFAEAFQWVAEALAGSLAAEAGRRLVFTGHSLGSALATLAASRWPPAALYTYGSPRVGDRRFRALFHAIPVERAIHCCDLVCQVPPSGVYKHVGARRYINREGKLISEPSSKYMAADQVRARAGYLQRHTFVWGNVAVRDLADHAPINYVNAFQRHDEDREP